MQAALAIAAALPFPPGLKAPLLFDDYVHLWRAAEGSSFAPVVRKVFAEHPIDGDGFFRPVGLLYFQTLLHWAGRSATAWHLCSVAIHALNPLLLYMLLRRLSAGWSPWTAFFGALLFAWHGSHVEAVCWSAASFDLLAAFFVLLSVTNPDTRRWSNLASCLTAALACLSKESAYCLPLLCCCLAFWERDAKRRIILQRSASVALTSAGVFAHRLWYLQGVGGYRTSAGSPQVFNMNWLSALQALSLRLWTQLCLPINRSVASEFWLRAA